MGAGPTRALTGGRRTKPTSTGCRRLRQPEPGRRSTYQAGEPVQTNRASSVVSPWQHAVSTHGHPVFVVPPPPVLPAAGTACRCRPGATRTTVTLYRQSGSQQPARKAPFRKQSGGTVRAGAPSRPPSVRSGPPSPAVAEAERGTRVQGSGSPVVSRRGREQGGSHGRPVHRAPRPAARAAAGRPSARMRSSGRGAGPREAHERRLGWHLPGPRAEPRRQGGGPVPQDVQGRRRGECEGRVEGARLHAGGDLSPERPRLLRARAVGQDGPRPLRGPAARGTAGGDRGAAQVERPRDRRDRRTHDGGAGLHGGGLEHGL